jgi:hypothetical protein
LASINYHADFTIICVDTSGEEQSDEQQAAEKPIGIEEQKPIDKNHGMYNHSVGTRNFFTPYLC